MTNLDSVTNTPAATGRPINPAGWLDGFLLRASRTGEADVQWWLLDNLDKLPATAL